MNCKKCGKQLNDESRFCHICGAPVEKAEYICKEINTADVEIAPDMPKPPALKKRKGIAKVAIMIAGGTLLIAGVLALALNFHTIRGWYIRSFQSPQDYLQFVIEGEIQDGLSGFAEKLSAFTVDALPKEATYSNTLRLHLGQMLTESLKNTSGISLPGEISLSALTAFENGKMQADVSLCLSDKHLIGGEAYFDTRNGKVWLNLPDLSEEPLLLDLKGKLSESEYTFDTATEILQILGEEKDAVAHIYEVLTDVTAGKLRAEELSRETVTIKDVTKEVTVLKVTQHTENTSATEALGNLLDDPKVIRLLERLDGPMGELLGEPSLDLAGVARQILDSMKEDGQLAETDDPIFYFYVDDYHNLIGKKLVYEGQTVYEEMQLQQNDRKIVRACFQDFCYDADFKERGGLYTGQCKVYDGSQRMMSIVFDGLGKKEGVLNGTVILTLYGAYLEKTTDSFSPDIKFRLSCNGDEDSSDVALRFEIAGIEMLTFSISSETLPKQPVSLPERGVDMTDADAVHQWVMALDYEQLFINLMEAGLPEEFWTLIMGAEP